MRELTYFPLLERFLMTSPYGQRVDPITGAPGSFHRGVDYGAPMGSLVIAPFDGQITTGYEAGGAGNWLWTVNGTDMFKSFHHSSHVIYHGWVSAGTIVAYIGATGASTGAHAHLELWDNGVNIDPTGYFNRAPLQGDDDMTEDDFARIDQMFTARINEAMKLNYTGQRALKTSDDPGVYELVYNADGELCRRHIPNPDQAEMLHWVDHLAGEAHASARTITEPRWANAFKALPIIND